VLLLIFLARVICINVKAMIHPPEFKIVNAYYSHEACKDVNSIRNGYFIAVEVDFDVINVVQLFYCIY